MSRLRVITQSFPNNDPWAVGNRSRELDVSISELLHAAITVGHPNYSIALGGGQVAAAYEMMWKVASTLMTIRDFGGPYPRSFLTPTERFGNLDPSEKRGATYQLGLTINKLMAWRLFGIRWLVHLDVYASQLSPVIRGGRSRPDLIGQDDQGDYYVFESKGRMSPPNATDKQKAKDQASRIVSVSGTTPALAASCMAYFRKDYYRARKHLECFVEDPPIDDGEGDKFETHRLNIKDAAIIREYYRPVMPLFDAKRFSKESEYLTWQSHDFDFEIQLDPKVHYLWQNEEYEAIRSYFADIDPIEEDRVSEAKDGIKVLPGDKWLELAKEETEYE